METIIYTHESCGIRPEKGCAGDAQQKLKTTDLTSHQRSRGPGSIPGSTRLSDK
jgi:hypothetical protein